MERGASGVAVKGALESAVALAYPKAGRNTLMFPNASDLYWGCFMT